MVYFKRKVGDYMSEYIKYNGAGIYCLTNERSGKKYIGSSKNVAMRVYQHQAALKAGRHENKAMQADYDSGDRFMASTMGCISGAMASMKYRQHMFPPI